MTSIGKVFVRRTFVGGRHVQDLFCYYTKYTPPQQPREGKYVEAVSIESLVDGIRDEILHDPSRKEPLYFQNLKIDMATLLEGKHQLVADRHLYDNELYELHTRVSSLA